MSSQFIKVHFPEKRPVFVDGVEAGKTGVRIEVSKGRHTINLGKPRNYAPKWRRPLVEETNASRPLPVVFEKIEEGAASATRAAEPTKQVFISYAHADRKWMEDLRRHLVPFNRLLKLEVWDDTRIKPGRAWRREIRRALRSSQVAVLLVSSHFLASDFIANEELPRLFEAAAANQMTIFWILVSDSAWQITAIRDYQAAHDVSRSLRLLTPGNQAKVLTEIAFKIWNAFP